jgi:hypothetical protein
VTDVLRRFGRAQCHGCYWLSPILWPHDQPAALLVTQVKLPGCGSSAAFSSGASTVPRGWGAGAGPQTRHERSFAAVLFFFFGAGVMPAK